MKKSPLFLIFPLLTLGVLSFAYSLSSDKTVYTGVEATGETLSDGLYFIKCGDYGVKMNPSSHVASLVSYSTIDTPFLFEHVKDDVYNISIDDNGVKRYLCCPLATEDADFRSEEDLGSRVKDIHIAYNENYEAKFILKAGDYWIKNYSNSKLKGTMSDPGYNLKLVSVDSSCSDLVFAIDFVQCDNGVTQPDKDEWDVINTPYTLLSTPLKNYLKIATYDKEHPENNTDLQNALMKYDYIVSKYKNEKVGDNPKYTNYLDREVKDMSYFDSYRITVRENSYSDYVIAGVLCVTTVIVGVTLLNIRRRKER